jgi:hypothetical protein
MPYTRLTNIEQFKFICGNVTPDINIKIRTCDYTTSINCAFLQCDGYTKIYTQWYMSYDTYTIKNGGGNHGVFYTEVNGIDNEPCGKPVITYTVPNINNIDELFAKEYEIVKLVGRIQKVTDKVHLFCNECDLEELLQKIAADIGMTDLTYSQKVKRYFSTFIGLPIGGVIYTAVSALSYSLLFVSGNCVSIYYQSEGISNSCYGLGINKRLIVMNKKIWKCNKICCDKLLYSHNTNQLENLDTLWEDSHFKIMAFIIITYVNPSNLI